jgi:hypothetical protein
MMTRIVVTEEAFEAIKATLPVESMEVDSRGTRNAVRPDQWATPVQLKQCPCDGALTPLRQLLPTRPQ